MVKTDPGGPEPPLCSCPTDHTAVHAASAPGPWAAEGLPGPGRPGGRRQGGRPTLAQLENKHCFCSGRSGACVRPPHSQLGVKGIPCLTKVERPFQSAQGLAGYQGRRAAPAARLGPEALAGDAGPWSLFSRLEWVPRRPQGRQDCRTWGPSQLHPSSPPALFQREGILFWGSERIATQSNSLILQVTRRGDETCPMSHSCLTDNQIC